jgi:HEPN domain-containing protein
MKPLTRDWVEKAEGDFLVATQIMRQRKKKNLVLDAACFHAQQSAEKYFKARLCEAGLSFPKTHDLVVLLNLLIGVEPLWSFLLPAAQALTDYAVDFRYPGDSATRDEAKQAIRDCTAIRREVRSSLRLAV